MPRLNKVFNLMRLIHIYVSSALFVLLIFFCFTGITLNHTNWLNGHAEQGQITGQLPDFIPSYVEAEKFSWLQQVNRHITSEFGLRQAKSVEWDTELSEVIFDYPVPAGYAAVVVNYASREVFIDHQSGSWLHIMNDLHKGRHSGVVWSWVIDVSALLMLIFSISGLILLYQNRKKRQTGSWLVFAGFLAPFCIYLLFVPSLHGV